MEGVIKGIPKFHPFLDTRPPSPRKSEIKDSKRCLFQSAPNWGMFGIKVGVIWVGEHDGCTLRAIQRTVMAILPMENWPFGVEHGLGI